MKCKVCGEKAVQSETEPGLWVHWDDEIVMNLASLTAEKSWDHEVVLDVIEARLIEKRPERTQLESPNELSRPVLEPPSF